MLKLTKTLLSAGVVLASASAAIAGDPPQALGLVATAEPIPIHCKGAECSVNLSAFCLQQKRRSPAPTDLYRQAATGSIQVSARTLDGAQVILDEKDLTFRPDPKYTSVRVSILRAAVATLDIGTAVNGRETCVRAARRSTGERRPGCRHQTISGYCRPLYRKQRIPDKSHPHGQSPNERVVQNVSGKSDRASIRLEEGGQRAARRSGEAMDRRIVPELRESGGCFTIFEFAPMPCRLASSFAVQYQ